MSSWLSRFWAAPPPEPAAEAPAPILRDTDRDWQIIGEQDPYHGVLTDPRFHRENLDDENLALFFTSGEHDIAHVLKRSREIFGEFEPRSALDFGCGVGRLTRPLAKLTGDAVGVDVSEGMLREARLYANPDAQFLDHIPDRSFDWVVTFIVLQHVTPAVGYDLIGKLLRSVAPGGRIALQITFARAEEHGADAGTRLIVGKDAVWPAPEGYDLNLVPPGIMIMHDYDLGRVIATFNLHGFGSVHLDRTDHGGVYGAMIHSVRD